MNWKLEVVVIPVRDVDRSKRFYSEKLGFKVDEDTVVGEMRVVELTPTWIGLLRGHRAKHCGGGATNVCQPAAVRERHRSRAHPTSRARC